MEEIFHLLRFFYATSTPRSKAVIGRELPRELSFKPP